MAKETLRRRVLRLAKGGNVGCKRLLALAQETRTPPKKIGRLCDEMNLRIRGCQLGCFR